MRKFAIPLIAVSLIPIVVFLATSQNNPKPVSMPIPVVEITATQPGLIHATFVIDSQTPSQAVGAIVASPTIDASARSAGAIWHVLDVQNATELTRTKLSATITSLGGPPCLVFQGQPPFPGAASTVLPQSGPVTTLTESAILNQIKAVTESH